MGGFGSASVKADGAYIVPYSENKIYQLAGGPTSDSTKPESLSDESQYLQKWTVVYMAKLQ